MRSLLLVVICSVTACVGARRPSEEILWAGRADTVLTYVSGVFATERSTLTFGYFPDDAASTSPMRPSFVGAVTDRRAGAVTLLPKPEGKHFELIRPQGVVDGRGIMHAVWAERLIDADSTPAGLLIRSIWASRFDGRRWSKPTRLELADEFYWAGVTESRIVGTADGSFHLAVAGYVRYTPGTIYHFVLRDGAWSVDRIQLPGNVGYAALAARDSSLSLSYISPAPIIVGNDRNSVWYLSSSDNGRTWSTPVLVSRSGEHAATRPHVGRDAKGVVHLVWAQDYSGDLYAEALRHVESRDGGRSWSSSVDLPVPGEYVDLLDAALDARGHMHALYWLNRDSLKVATFAQGTWTPARAVPSTFSFFAGGFLVSEADGSLGVVWTGLRRTAPDVVQLAWLRTRLDLGAR